MLFRRSMPVDEVEETANFCQLMNDFFDGCNVRSVHEHERKQNKLLAPHEKCDDPRFMWLTETFLQYFFNWKEEINSKAEEFTKDQMGRMFISIQTFEGLQISVHSLIECTKFLLESEVKYVLTEWFMQDCLEEYFGNQRQRGGRSGQTILMQFSLGITTGFSKCKEMLVSCPEEMLEQDVWKGVTLAYHQG